VRGGRHCHPLLLIDDLNIVGAATLRRQLGGGIASP
jgi:hypothetical protein